MANKIPKDIEKRLRRAAVPEGADSYAAYLLKVGDDTGAADKKRQSAATEAARLFPDYGAKGEALAEGGLADDGYAAYLRRAAKEQRAARANAAKAERTEGARAAMSGYAAYLDSERTAQETRLLEAARALLNVPLDAPTERDMLIDAATERPDTATLLREVHATLREEHPEGNGGAVTDVVSYIVRNSLTYENAYAYCRLLGYSSSYAEQIARYATSERSDLTEELESLFGD